MIDIKAFKCSEDFSALRVLVGEYSFNVFGMQDLHIKVWYHANPPGEEHYSFTQSHCFGAPPELSATFAGTEELALRKAMTTLTTFFPPPDETQPADVQSSAWSANSAF